MTALMPIGLPEQIDEVMQEVDRRRRVYGELARTGSMNARKAWRKIDVMTAVLETLRNLRALQEIDHVRD